MMEEPIFFRRTPIHYLKGYTNIFKSDEAALINKFGEKGYQITWLIKNGQLYISRIKLINGFIKFEKNDKGEVVEKLALKTLTDAEIKDRIEKFTGVKFNKDGLLEANWVDGVEILYDIQQGIAAKSYEELSKHYSDIRMKCKEYQLVIAKGKIKEISELGYYNSKR